MELVCNFTSWTKPPSEHRFARLDNRESMEAKFRKGQILLDSGANCCISNDRSDFNIYHPGGPQQVDGIGKGLNIVGHGEVKWTIKGDNGRFRTLYLNVYYVPSVTTRIASITLSGCSARSFMGTVSSD